MSSKSRQSREQHEDKADQPSAAETPKPYAKVRGASRGTTERTAAGGALSRRLARQSLPLRRGQRGGTKG
ncbi:hypothetical protein ACIBEJ_10795 [Nonomuraea sp. NPDC050790]|uniref:hypothetical protein n=1 Tax=Nonomuraea sp. NPDC050790 TaxID=3364371 RepID=UPI0037B50A9B